MTPSVLASPPPAVSSARRVLVPTKLPRTLALGGGAPARTVWTFEGSTMGTYWRARVVSKPAEAPTAAGDAHRIIVDALSRVVSLMSPWEPGSDLGRFAAASSGEWITLAPETATVLNAALKVAAATDGNYDPTLGDVVDLLGFGPTDPVRRVPLTAPSVHAARRAAGFEKLDFDRGRCAVRQPGGQRLDLCSIAKGFAVDLVSKRLRAAGWTEHFIEIGGEALGRGCKPNGQPWWCELETPSGLPPTVAALCELAIATSGNALRHFEDPTGVVGHIISARPADSSPVHSVTVLAPTCMEADVWATALYAVGSERGLDLANPRGLAARWILQATAVTPDCHEIRTAAFDALLN